MASITAAGAGSGLNIESIVSGLMSVERQPLTKLQTQASKYNTQVSDIGKLTSALSSLKTAAQKLSSYDFLDANTATSSDLTAITVKADGTASNGTYAIQTTQMASAQADVYDLGGMTDGKLTFGTAGTNPATITVNGKTVNLGTGEVKLTPAELAAKINGAGVGATAMPITDKTGQQRLVISGQKTGAIDGVIGTTSFASLTGGSAALNATDSKAPKNAEFTINGISAVSQSNSVSGVIGGLTFTLQKEGIGSVTVGRDDDAIAKKVDDFVTSYNAVVSQLTSMKSGSFGNDSLLRSVKDQLYAAVSAPTDKTNAAPGPADYSPLASLGIKLGVGGSLVFNKTDFTKALAKDADGVKAAFASNAEGVTGTVNTLTDPDKGLVTNRKSTLDANVKANSSKQELMSAQLVKTEARLRAQYGALDASLTKMQSSLANMKSMLGIS